MVVEPAPDLIMFVGPVVNGDFANAGMFEPFDRAANECLNFNNNDGPCALDSEIYAVLRDRDQLHSDDYPPQWADARSSVPTGSPLSGTICGRCSRAGTRRSSRFSTREPNSR